MAWLRRVLGLALLGTAVWLIAVLAGVGGGTAALAVALLGAAAIGVLALAVAAPALLRSAAPASAATDADWAAFDRAAIDRHVREGRTVFVDVTADWCITCRVNKTAVLGRDPVRSLLQRDPVVAMRADWTRPDETIAGYLASFGRYGIPFNAVYGPGAPGGIALPELLTDAAVLAALEQAGPRSQ
jgi:suppressor for copper-sensitivity B